jgi:hypothetical protein
MGVSVSTPDMKVMTMSKSTIAKVFLGSVVALVAGLVLMVVAAAVAYKNGSLIMNGPDIVGVRPGLFGWALLVLAVLGLIAMIGAVVAQFVAWIAAVVNTAQLPDKTWFVVLLITGLLSFGLVAMVAYLVAGPPDRRPVSGQPIPTQSRADMLVATTKLNAAADPSESGPVTSPRTTVS